MSAVKIRVGTASPYARTNTEIVRAVIVLLVMWNSTAIWAAAGATIEDETGEMKV